MKKRKSVRWGLPHRHEPRRRTMPGGHQKLALFPFIASQERTDPGNTPLTRPHDIMQNKANVNLGNVFSPPTRLSSYGLGGEPADKSCKTNPMPEVSLWRITTGTIAHMHNKRRHSLAECAKQSQFSDCRADTSHAFRSICDLYPSATEYKTKPILLGQE